MRTLLAYQDTAVAIARYLGNHTDLLIAQPIREDRTPRYGSDIYAYPTSQRGTDHGHPRHIIGHIDLNHWIATGLVVPWDPRAEGLRYNVTSFTWYRLSDAGKTVAALGGAA